MEFLNEPWPWYVAGPIIALVMFMMLYFGKSFGVSSTLRTMCSMGGAGKCGDFFQIDWKAQIWNIVFIIGAAIGGWIASEFMMSDQPIDLSASTVSQLEEMGIEDPGASYVPMELFSWDNVMSTQGLILMVLGGFLVGFGTRYAGGCTSGHAISGLSNLQIPSLIAVIGFFIGGLLMTHFILPYILNL